MRLSNYLAEQIFLENSQFLDLEQSQQQGTPGWLQRQEVVQILISESQIN